MICCLLRGGNSFVNHLKLFNPSTSKSRITVKLNLLWRYDEFTPPPQSPPVGWTDQFCHCSLWVPGATISFLLSLFQGLQLILWAKSKNFNSRLIYILAHWNKPGEKWEWNHHLIQTPIKIETPLQSLLLFSCIVGEGNILQTVLLSFFFSFYFLDALRSDNHSNSFCLQA